MDPGAAGHDGDDGDLRALLLVAGPSDLADYGLARFDTLAAVQCARLGLQPIPCDVLAFGIPGALGPPTLDALCTVLTARNYAILQAAEGALGLGSGGLANAQEDEVRQADLAPEAGEATQQLVRRDIPSLEWFRGSPNRTSLNFPKEGATRESEGDGSYSIYLAESGHFWDHSCGREDQCPRKRSCTC